MIAPVPSSLEEIKQDLKQDISADLIVPVCFGIAEQDYGVRGNLSTAGTTANSRSRSLCRGDCCPFP
ncbi:MAG: hypothetical protein ABEI32_04815, partial [Halothece sp.]